MARGDCVLFKEKVANDFNGKVKCLELAGLVYFLQQLVQFRTKVINAKTQFMFSYIGQSPRNKRLTHQTEANQNSVRYFVLFELCC